jgi:hypothetical protein
VAQIDDAPSSSSQYHETDGMEGGHVTGIDAMSKIVPTSGGTIIGLLFAYVYWDGMATGTCNLGTSSIVVECVETAVGSFTSFVEFATLCSVVGGLVGLVVTAIVAATTERQPT